MHTELCFLLLDNDLKNGIIQVLENTSYPPKLTRL